MKAVASCGGFLANLRCGGCFDSNYGDKATLFLAFGRQREGKSVVGAKNSGRWSR